MAQSPESAEETLARSMIKSRDNPSAWDFENPLSVDRGQDPVAELYLTVPIARMQTLIALAGERGLTVTEALQAALDAYLDSEPSRQKV